MVAVFDDVFYGKRIGSICGGHAKLHQDRFLEDLFFPGSWGVKLAGAQYLRATSRASCLCVDPRFQRLFWRDQILRAGLRLADPKTADAGIE